MKSQTLMKYQGNPAVIEAAAVILIALCMLAGWKVGAMQFITMTNEPVALYQAYSQIPAVAPKCITKGWDMFEPGLVVFILSYLAAYACPAITKLAGWTRQGTYDGSRLSDSVRYHWLAITCVQAASAALLVNYTRLLSTRFYAGASEAVIAMATITLIPVICTYLMRWWGPKLSLAVMPVAILVAAYALFPTAYHAGMLDKGLIGVHNSASAVLETIMTSLAFKGSLTKGVVGWIVKSFSGVAFVGGLSYVVFRPMRVIRAWNGRLYGAAFNGFIVMYMVLMPYIEKYQGPPLDGAQAFRLADAVRFTSDNCLSYMVWSWMIGNAITLTYLFLNASKSQERPNYMHNNHMQQQTQAAPIQENTQKAKPGNRLSVTPEREAALMRSLYGQEEALKQNISVLKEMDGGKRSVGVSLLLGPTGVGKTETARKVADIFFEGRLARYDMNQFTSSHEASRLLGSPQGYVGSEQGGNLVSDLLEKSPCVVLLDEIEKVHPSILKTLLQFIEGLPVKDAIRRTATADNCFIIMTSNAMPERSAELSALTPQKVRAILKNYTVRTAEGAATRIFAPEFIGRVNYIIPYRPITRAASAEILGDMVDRKAKDSQMSVAEGSIKALCTLIDPTEGFRGIKNAFTTIVENFLMLDGRRSLRGLTMAITVKAGNVIFSLTDSKGKIVKSNNIKINRSAIDPKLTAGMIEYLQDQVVGQDAAILEICGHLKVAASGALPNNKRPLGIFLLSGPSGVGKTETARALAQHLFNGRLIKKDMGELKHPADARRLFGDHHTAGELTQEVSELGSCVVLLDEVEKAHPEVFDALLSFFDDGELQDAASSIRVSFRDTVIIMTTNLLSDQAGELWMRSNEEKRGLLGQFFRTEFLGRIDKILFYQPLNQNMLNRILIKRVAEIIGRYEGFGIAVTVRENVYAAIRRRVETSAYGARALDSVIKDTVGEALAEIPEGTETVELLATESGKIVRSAKYN